VATKYDLNWFSFLRLVFLSILSLGLAGCGTPPGTTPILVATETPTLKPPPNVKLSVSHTSEEPAGGDVANVQEGEGVAIVIKIEPYEPLDWTWSVSGTSGGTLNANQGENVVYTAGTRGVDIVVAEAKTAAGGVIKQQVTINVEATTIATDTPVAAGTPTAVPDPIACHHPAVTKKLFPQLENVNGQFPMYGPETEPNFLCKAVYDRVHTPGGIAVHLKYDNVGANFGWWGIAIKDPDSYDASQYRQVCFWVFAEQPNQAFRVKMKDKAKKEAGDVVTTEVTGQWDQICTNISDFADAGIQVDRMDNINLGFEQPSGSAEIWVADFEFK
jgi:hypothetical protein